MSEPATQPPWFAQILAKHRRVAIVGGPRTGKTSLAATVADRPTFGTDDIMNLPWEEVPRATINHSLTLGPSWVIEGVQVARALRKGLRADVVVHLTKQHIPVTTGQKTMKKAVETVFAEWATSPGRTVIVERRT